MSIQGEATWWAGGLSLTERLPGAGRPDPARLDAARRRLKRWAEAHDLAATGQFARRLADAGLDEDALLGLLAEGPDRLAARTSRPSWAAFVDHALAAEPTTGQAGAATWQGHFAAALGRLTAAAQAEVAGRIGSLASAGAFDPAALVEDFGNWLGIQLARIAARTLVLELNVARVSGTLTGATARERFAEFAERLATADGLATVLAEYPVLGRLLGQACEQFTAAHVELVERFTADRDAVVAGLLGGMDPGPLARVERDHADPHQRGRMVAVLRFADGVAVVYKPRCQALQQRFGELVGWLNHAMPGLDLFAPAVLPRDGYGWMAHITHRPCTEVAEVDRFYRRQGALLALLYALDGTDIHCENLIAAGDQPVLVDVETLFHPTLAPVTAAGLDPASQALSESVCRTALLPLLLVGEHGAMDISGLGGDPGATFPFAVVGWDDTGTDGMRLVRKAHQFAGVDNQPKLGTERVDPADYRAALLTGFHAGYDAILANRTELLALVDSVADEEVRVVLRPTQLYVTLLDESTHPDVLREGLERDTVLDLLWADSVGDPLKERLVRHELADLWAGDVPIFFSRAGTRDVWTSTGERLPGALAESGCESVRAKLARMDEVDRHDQDWLITATFATRTGPIHHHSGQVPAMPVAPAAPEPRLLLAAACGVADELVARAVHDDERANWLGLELVDDRHWGVVPLGAGLAGGYLGVALFLAQLGELTGTSRYLDLAARALRPVPRLLATLAENPAVARSVGPGGFLGTGGICYGLARISVLLGDTEIRDWCEWATGLVVGSDDGIAGFAAGRAGGVAALLATHAETGLVAAARAAAVLAERLSGACGANLGHGTTARTQLGACEELWEPVVVDTAGKPIEPDGAFPATGFAGGLEGVAYALHRAGEVSAAAEVLDRATPLAVRLRGTDHGWCCGLAGALLAHTTATEDDLTDAVALLGDRHPVRDTSLCHGELGVLEALTVLSGRGHAGATAALAPAVSRLLGALDAHGVRCGTPAGVPTPGLLTGLAGIGYGLIRLGFTEQVPSVLLLEPRGPAQRSETTREATDGERVRPGQGMEGRRGPRR